MFENLPPGIDELLPLCDFDDHGRAVHVGWVAQASQGVFELDLDLFPKLGAGGSLPALAGQLGWDSEEEVLTLSEIVDSWIFNETIKKHAPEIFDLPEEEQLPAIFDFVIRWYKL